MAMPLYTAASLALKPISALERFTFGLLGSGAGGESCGFQPVTSPFSEAKRKIAGLVRVPLVTAKSDVPLKTWPVGAASGMRTSRPTFAGVFPGTSVYRVLRSAPLEDTQKALFELKEIPQALIRWGSVTGAMPGWSATRSVAM